MGGAFTVEKRSGRKLREHTHIAAGWFGPRFGLLGLVALLLAACGLEPRFVLPPPERDDGTFRWIDALDAPPDDYLPVTFPTPATGERLAVCRGWIVDEPQPEQGYHTGELRGDVDGEKTCFVAHRGGLLRFVRGENAYQQLWVRAGTLYTWAALEQFPERPLTKSALWTGNRVPGNFVRGADSHTPIAYWMPCAATVEGEWRLGKMSLRDSFNPSCYVQLDRREIGVTSGILVLYSSVE